MKRRAPRGYRLLLSLFPEAFRARFGAEMEETFVALLAQARRRGRWAVALVWLRGAVDAGVRGIGERVRPGSVAHVARPGDAPADRVSGTRGGDVMGAMLADVRYAVRSLVRKPVFVLTVGVTLALGIGANTAIFSLVNGLLVRPLPYPEPDELVVLFAEHRELGWSGTDVNLADAWDWRARAGVFEDLAVYNEASYNLTGGDRPELLDGVVTTPNVLGILGAEPALGRDLTTDDAREGAPLAVLISDGLWERRFGRDPDILDRTLLLDGEVAAVVGVLPPDFVFHDGRPEVFAPFRLDPTTAPRGSHDREAVARLAEGVTLERAREAVNRVARALQEEHPEQNRGWTAQVVPLEDDLLGDIAKQASLVLMGAVTFVLLMACTNVANLILARGNARRTELTVRAALGAGRGR
ncbi:MAG TPA: ABC transporter permease, partial [Longimicrobiales bacterium]|nr:ABC transporter permease [Longimicrobiales bacterium]